MHAFLALLLSFCAPKAGPVIPNGTAQLVVGIVPAWDGTTAVLYRFERTPAKNRKRLGKWRRVGKSWDAFIGRNGLAAGRGLLEWCGDPQDRKVESDWKAPAGAFYFGKSYAFGPGLKAAPPGKVTPITPTMVCVSDPHSKQYNRIVDAARFGKPPPWDWARPLRRPDGIKSRAIMIGANGAADPEADPPKTGEGSCVLFHLSRGRPSVGCTTLPPRPLDALIAWLKPEARPVYVLMTREQYAELAALPGSGLPKLP